VELVPLYWLAGIPESEGTFLSAPPSQPSSPIVRICMTDADVVTHAATLLDRAVTPVPPRKAHYKPPFITQIKGAEAIALMSAVRPVLGPERTAQVDRVLAGRAPYRRLRATSPRFPLLERFDGTSREPNALSWLAGLLEGEGTFVVTCDAQQRCSPVLSVNMCDRAVVRRVGQLLGAPSVTFRKARKPAWRPTYLTKVGGAHAAEWMTPLREFMGERRRSAIDFALASYKPVRLVSPPVTCIVASCSEPHRGRGLCHKHYMMWSRDRANGREARITPLR
jgi:hypothetical protein